MIKFLILTKDDEIIAGRLYSNLRTKVGTFGEIVRALNRIYKKFPGESFDYLDCTVFVLRISSEYFLFAGLDKSIEVYELTSKIEILLLYTQNFILNNFEKFKDRIFNLVSGWDEIVSSFIENISLGEIDRSLKMESNEEVLYEIMTKNKMNEAKENAKNKARQLGLKNKSTISEESRLQFYDSEPIDVKSRTQVKIAEDAKPLRLLSKGDKNLHVDTAKLFKE